MLENYYHQLSKTALFKTNKEVEIKSLIECLSPKIKTYEKNEYVAIVDDDVHYLGIVLKGSISLYKESQSGSNMLISILKTGDLFGEALVFLDHSKYPVNILATENTELMLISKERIINQCSNACSFHTNLIRNLLEVLSKKVVLLNKKVDYLSIKNMRAKIATFLIEEYKKTNSTSLLLSMSRNELADFLNVSRPSMSREMGRMRDEGIIRFYKNRVTILNLDSLKENI